MSTSLYGSKYKILAEYPPLAEWEYGTYHLSHSANKKMDDLSRSCSTSRSCSHYRFFFQKYRQYKFCPSKKVLTSKKMSASNKNFRNPKRWYSKKSFPKKKGSKIWLLFYKKICASSPDLSPTRQYAKSQESDLSCLHRGTNDKQKIMRNI